MKSGREEISRAARVKAVVDLVLSQSRSFTHIGRRIEELLGEPLAQYPDQIISLELLPTIDGFSFIGWTADFLPVECRQDQLGQQMLLSASAPLVGWKPKRCVPLAGRIETEENLRFNRR